MWVSPVFLENSNGCLQQCLYLSILVPVFPHQWVNNDKWTHLSFQSFRFGAEIAYVGATILKVCKRVEKILVGGKQQGKYLCDTCVCVHVLVCVSFVIMFVSVTDPAGRVCDETAAKVTKDVWRGVSPCRGKTAILSRCNVTVFKNAVELTDANPHCRIHFIGVRLMNDVLHHDSRSGEFHLCKMRNNLVAWYDRGFLSNSLARAYDFIHSLTEWGLTLWCNRRENPNADTQIITAHWNMLGSVENLSDGWEPTVYMRL